MQKGGFACACLSCQKNISVSVLNKIESEIQLGILLHE